MKRVDYYQKLEELFDYEVPGYIREVGKSFIVIRVSDWRGEQDLKVRVEDVIEYYAVEARNILSGCRTLAGYASDWRGVDELAKLCLAWFKYVNRDELRRQGHKRGMELRD